MKIRRIEDDDIARITEIYNWYILNTTITFEVEAISPLEMRKRVQAKIEKHDWLVGEVNQQIIGYAYYGAYRSRAAYSHTVESSIYLAQESTGKGFGKSLYGELVRSAKEHGFRELIGIIALPNQGSTILHRKLGFEEIGVLKNVGHKFDRYINVGIWQKSTS
ncbi:N-acetyltransferase family protein [Phormidium tenue FACHB-886]|nr:N-acetyltransferase family protein [Phormidium tenue FACHB-886]